MPCNYNGRLSRSPRSKSLCSYMFFSNDDRNIDIIMAYHWPFGAIWYVTVQATTSLVHSFKFVTLTIHKERHC